MTKKPPNEDLEHKIKVLTKESIKYKRTAAKLKMSEDRFRAVSGLISDYAYAFRVAPDGQLTLEWVTGALPKITGFTREELHAKGGWESLIYTEDLSIPMAQLRSLFENKARTVEYRIVTKSNQIKWMKDSARPQLNQTSGRLERIYGAVHDITERKQTEKELKESEKKFRNIIQASPMGILMYDLKRDNRLVFIGANSGACNILGIDQKSLIGKTIEEAFPGLAKTDIPQRYRDIAQNGKTWQTDQIDYHEGSISGAFEVVAFQTEPNKMAVLFNDITERKRAEEDLLHSHNTFLTVLDGIDATIYVADISTYEILFMNKHMIEVFGGDLTGRICHEEFRGENHPCSHCTNDQLLEPNGKPTGVCTWETKNPVTHRWYINYDRAIRWVDGRMVRLQIATDITKLKELEEERIQTEMQLRQAQKMESIGRLAGGVAHDFNNMLGVLIGHTELAMEEVDPSLPLHADLKEIYDAARRSADLTRQLLAFARKQTILPRVLNLNQTVTGMLKMLGRLIGEDTELIWNPDENLWSVKIDPAQVDQILANLCVNSRDAVAGTGKITIETKNATLNKNDCIGHEGLIPGEYVVLKVSDDGCGMDEKTIDNLFEPFFTTKDVGLGTGLGLSTVYGIVKQNKGFIYAASEPGKGATFSVYFRRSQEGVEENDDPNGNALKTGDETILLVEDEISFLRLSTTVLKRFGYTLLSAHTPFEAIAIAKKHNGPIDLLITDVVMPEMNGHKLMQLVQKLKPNMKVLFMSGYTPDALLDQGVFDDVGNFIAKPFSAKSLANKVREILDH